jgi:[acyl-carrier-protein] S-malonyltransferase
VVAGDTDALTRFRQKAREAKIKVIPLGVSTAFHSAMMKPAAAKLETALEDVDFFAPETTIYANLTGGDLISGKPESVSDGEWIRSRLVMQVMSPVYWQETIENMAEAGVELFIELGPGKALSGFVRKTRPEADVLNVENAESLGEVLLYMKERAK